MKKEYFYLIPILILVHCVFNAENYNKIFIDQEIKKAVEVEIIDTIMPYKNAYELHYMNNFYHEFYSNDSLQIFNFDDDKHRPFCSYWGAEGDTVFIYGFFGEGSQGHYGVEINIVDKTPKVFLSIHPHVMREFSYTKSGKVEFDIKVPTESSKVILSEIPDNKHPNTIFGLVEFGSKEFFQISKYENGEEMPNQRDRVKCNMKIYFKANQCDSLERM